MPRLTGLIHVCNHERQVGRALLSLRPCDEVLVIDHGSKDGTLRVAREHGARIIQAGGTGYDAYARKASHDWILCLLPCEAIAEDLEASLLEWKASVASDDQAGFTISIRQQTGVEWKLLQPELRLVNRKKVSWTNELPVSAFSASALDGYILRIREKD